MTRGSRKLGSLVLSLALAAPGGTLGATAPADEEAVVHALNRLAYGPRPGDVERVRAMGLDRWIDLQLHPDRLPDRDLEARLAALRTVGLPTADLMKGYEIPPDARREMQRRKAELGENPSEEDVRSARRELVAKYAPRMAGSPRLVLEELQEAKLIRAVYAERQLDEVLVDFWINHFNVYAQKGPDRFLLGQYERETIRPHAWGTFEDLLRATAESPAMLFYLDNWLSADPSAAQRLLPGRRRRRFGGEDRAGSKERRCNGRRLGLNENYAREIMELHTLGVDGGYSQKDVTEVARCFTGWTIKGLRQQRPEFRFEPRLHDRGDKVVLGHVIKGGGKDEGEQVIRILATHPSTGRFVALKLARRFVSDDPPAALVDRAADTFRQTGGDIRAVVTTLVTSPEFFASEARATKIKTPLEFVVSALRASGARVYDASELAGRLRTMGMPLYLQQPPTGYKDTSDAWLSTSGLVARLNFALDLAAGRIRGVTVDAPRLDPARLVPGGLSQATRLTLDAEAAGSPTRTAGLVLGSPEFQRK